MLNYCSKGDALFDDAIVGCSASGTAVMISGRHDPTELVVTQLCERLERSLKDWTASLDSNSAKSSAFGGGVENLAVVSGGRTDRRWVDNQPVVVLQSADATLIQISGTPQRKLEPSAHPSSRFIVSPTPNAMPAATTSLTTASFTAMRDSPSEPLCLIVPGATWTSRAGSGDPPTKTSQSCLGDCVSSTLKIATGSSSPISTTGSLHNRCSEAISTGTITGIVQSSSSSPTNSVDSGVSSPAAYNSIVDETPHFVHHHHQHVHHQYHSHHHPIMTVASSTPAPANGLHVRHHHRSTCQQSVAQITNESRFFQFGVNGAPISSVNYNNTGVLRPRSASWTESRLLQYSPLCAACCGCATENARILFEDGLRLHEDECGGSICRRSTLSPLCESPRDDTMVVSDGGESETKELDELDNDKTITGVPQLFGSAHASILPTADDVFVKKLSEQGISELSAAGSKQQSAENFERNGINGVRCMCTLPTPLSSVISFNSSQIISCSAPPTPTIFSSPNFCKSEVCCTSAANRVHAADTSSSGMSDNGNKSLKSILKKPVSSVPCGCVAGGMRGMTGHVNSSRRRFRLSRSVSESAGDDFGDLGLTYAFNGIELDESNAKSDYFSSSQLSSDMEMDTTEDESSRSSWENGAPLVLTCCGSFDVSRSSTLDSSDSSMNAESSDEKIVCELVPRKKRVSFSEHVQARIYRSSASILGQKKKNDKRNRSKRRRAESEGGDAASNDDLVEATVKNTKDETENGGKDDNSVCGPSTAKVTALCDSCHKLTKVTGTQSFTLRRDSGIDDETDLPVDNSTETTPIEWANENITKSPTRHVCANCLAVADGSTDILAAKRIRRLVSADSALGDDETQAVKAL